MNPHPAPQDSAPLPDDDAVAWLRPANVDEAGLAAVYVAAQAQALACLRLAGAHSDDAPHVLRCVNTATRMMREARATRALLERIQAERRQTEADVAAPAPPAAPEPAAAPSSIAAQADQYALRHRKRAALIRALGRLPDRIDCGPLPPEVVRAIVTGTSPVLRSLDPRPRPAAVA